MSEPTFMVRRACRHGQHHPHAVTVFHHVDGEEDRWCTAGDFETFTMDQLSLLIFGVLAVRDPQIDGALADVKADQVADALAGQLREVAAS